MSTSADRGGKAPTGTEGATTNLNGGARYPDTELITAEPPKQTDLQVSPKSVTYATYLLALLRTCNARRSRESGMVWEND
jgi:hypothetical protein